MPARKPSLKQAANRRYFGKREAAARAYAARNGGSRDGLESDPEYRRVLKNQRQWMRDEARRREAAAERERIEREGVMIAAGDDASAAPADDPDDPAAPIRLEFPEGPYWLTLTTRPVEALIERAEGDDSLRVHYWYQSIDDDPDFVGYNRIDIEQFISLEFADAREDDTLFSIYRFYQWIYIQSDGNAHFIIRLTNLQNG